MIPNFVLKMKELELEPVLNGTDETSHSDDDLCDMDEINRQFLNSKLLSEEVISKNKYVLHITSTRGNYPSIGVALSDDTCEILSSNNSKLQSIATLKGNTGSIVDCKFSKENDNLVYTCSNDGYIKLWDIRTPKTSVIDFVDTTSTDSIKKDFNCFDISPNTRLLTAGTDLFEGDAFLLFWDIRNEKLLGGYWESHTDDITQVKFHDSDSNRLISGSTDGLINIYDVSQTNEDDALIDTLNTESSVEKLQWYSESNKDFISCITHTADLQIWKIDDAEPSYHFRRNEIADEIKRKSKNYIYLINTHPTNNSLLILCGSNVNDGECIRGLQYSQGRLIPALSFSDNNQRVRSSCFNEHTNILLTGGEKGILDLWKVDIPQVSFSKKVK